MLGLYKVHSFIQAVEAPAIANATDTAVKCGKFPLQNIQFYDTPVDHVNFPPVLLQAISQQVHDDSRTASHFGCTQIAEHHERCQAIGTSTKRNYWVHIGSHGSHGALRS